MQHATNQLDNPLKIAETKRDIARIKTVIREKELRTAAMRRRKRSCTKETLRKTSVGKVVSDKMDKTVVVAIEDRVAHPLYKKIVEPHL